MESENDEMRKEKKMNILMMVSWFGAKDGSYTGGSFHYEQVKSLNKYCNCAIYYPYDRSLNEPCSVEKERGILTYRTKYQLEKKLRNRIYMIRTMKRIMEEFHPDLIHANVATEAGRFAVMLGKLFHIPVMVTEHSAVEASGVTSFPHHQYAWNVYRNSRYNACVSDDLTNKLRAIFPKYEFHTIYNGIREMGVKEKTRDYRKEGLTNIGVVAGFYSREIKGMQFLLPAIKRMKDDGYHVMLHVMGGGDYLSEYQQLAKELSIEDTCIFYGRCEKEKLFAIEAEMDFMVSASLFESFGCAVAEGMMLGKPTVATKSGGVESIVTDENGILVEKGSTDELYRGLTAMYQMYENYNPQDISDYANQKFSLDSISRKYMEIYKIITEDAGVRNK